VVCTFHITGVREKNKSYIFLTTKQINPTLTKEK